MKGNQQPARARFAKDRLSKESRLGVGRTTLREPRRVPMQVTPAGGGPIPVPRPRNRDDDQVQPDLDLPAAWALWPQGGLDPAQSPVYRGLPGRRFGGFPTGGLGPLLESGLAMVVRAAAFQSAAGCPDGPDPDA